MLVNLFIGIPAGDYCNAHRDADKIRISCNRCLNDCIERRLSEVVDFKLAVNTCFDKFDEKHARV